MATEQVPQTQSKLPGITPFARFMDRAGRWVITAGGLGVIASVVGIFVFVLIEAYPLFQMPSATQKGSLDLSAYKSVLTIGIDPYQAVSYVVHRDGIDFLNPDTGALILQVRPEGLGDGHIVSAYRSLGDGYVGLGLNDGRLMAYKIDYQIRYDDAGKQFVTPECALAETIVLDEQGQALTKIAYHNDGDGQSVFMGVVSDGRLLFGRTLKKRGLLGGGKAETVVHDLTKDVAGAVTAMALLKSGRMGMVGTELGEAFQWDLPRNASSRPTMVRRFPISTRAVTALEFLLGDISLVAGDAGGEVSAWMPVRITEGANDQIFQKIHTLQAHSRAVAVIAPSARDKQFLTGDVSGQLALHHLTSAQTFFRFEQNQSIVSAVFAPKANGFLACGVSGRLVHYELHNPHPEITLHTLFGKVWYEGYAQPEYVWQSTGGSDDFEPKISLMPLIFGTAKGTFYAVLFALPLAVLAAIYTSEFASPGLRNIVKPTVELMASLPSVILGFLAGLWLAPLLENEAVGALLLLPLVPSVVIVCAYVWGKFPENFVRRVPDHWQLVLFMGIALFAAWLAFVMGPVAERIFFGGHFQNWLRDASGSRYDQRNCLVVGFAMGFAVIPIIYTICEDALSSVPSHLRAGSLALGATPWQTAMRVVLPTASPGIFSATMVGFGRAVGETMIVLMATGNTPIMEWSVFNGMRTMSANIAVEIPEAPHEGTLYRVLFLTGLLLAAVTFLVNTVAEVVRQRLRERYSRI